jgi:hypothetical protein
MNVDVIGYIIIPLALAVIGGTIASVRGAVKFASYMTRSETFQGSIAKTNQDISDKLTTYIEQHEKEHKVLTDRLLTTEILFNVEHVNGHHVVNRTKNDV